MNKVEKIKAEIERLNNELIQEVEKGYKSEFDEGRISAFEDMITFIDSLEEDPVSEDLEEAARKAATWHSRVEGDKFFPNDYHKFIAGAQWQKEQIMKNAVEAVIHPYDGEIWVDKDLLSIYNDCQRVKLIIIEEK